LKRKFQFKNKITSSLLFAAIALAFIGCSGGGGNGSSTSDNPLPAFPNMPSEAAETPAINQTLDDFKQALESKDVAGAGELFTPEVRTDMEAWLDAHQDLMPKLAEVLTSMPLSSLSDEYGWAEEGDRRRSAEVSVEDDGITFYIRLEKVDGDWKILSF
jgi:hypothetical protein